jgi:hypothetical protein
VDLGARDHYHGSSSGDILLALELQLRRFQLRIGLGGEPTGDGSALEAGVRAAAGVLRVNAVHRAGSKTGKEVAAGAAHGRVNSGATAAVPPGTAPCWLVASPTGV